MAGLDFGPLCLGIRALIWDTFGVEVLETQPFVHPCLSCGACCASYRVAFYWREAEPSEHETAVPKNLWEELTERHRCMKGTNNKHQPKCVALSGQIGKDANCTIYHNRPAPCRDFEASYEHGEKNERCDQARAKHGLRALSRSDYRNRLCK